MPRPLLEIFTTTWNDQVTVKELIVFYRERVPNCLISISDNMSTDGTEKIAKENNCKFTTFDTGGKMDESTLINLRNNSWKSSDAHYVIICDADELIDTTECELLGNLQTNSWNIAKCNGVELYGESVIGYKEFSGVWSEGYSKQSLFLKDAIKEINYGAGSHKAEPVANDGYEIKYSENPPMLIHTKWQDWERGMQRQKEIAPRVSEEDLKTGRNFHYGLWESTQRIAFERGLKNKVKIK